MKSLFLSLFLLLPSTAFATGHCGVQQVQKVQQFNHVQAVQAYAIPIPVIAQHQNFIQQYAQVQQQVEYVAAAPVKQKIVQKQKVQRQVVRQRNLRQRVKEVNVQNVQKIQKVQVQQINAY